MLFRSHFHAGPPWHLTFDLWLFISLSSVLQPPPCPRVCACACMCACVRAVEMSHLWLSTLHIICSVTVINYTKKLPWWDLRATPIYQERDADLEGNLILCPFSKMIVVGSFLEPVSTPTMGSWSGLQCQACIFSCGAALKFNQKAAGYPIHTYHNCTQGRILPLRSSLQFTGFTTVEQSSLPPTPRSCKKPVQHLLVLWEPSSMEEASREVLTWFLHVLGSAYVGLQRWSLTIKFRWAAKSKGNRLYCFKGLWEKISYVYI